LFELLLKGRKVIGGTFGIGRGWINVPEPPTFTVGDEVGALFLRFALIHEPTIQGSGGEPKTIINHSQFPY
jgi:hypothetical protein